MSSPNSHGLIYLNTSLIHYKCLLNSKPWSKLSSLFQSRHFVLIVGGEFTSTKFNQLCANNCIIHQLSCSHTPQQNGVAERKHRHLIQCALALSLSPNYLLPISYRSYAVSTVAHLINRLPTPNLKQKTPWELLFHKPPDIQYLRTFGCQCFPLLTPYTAHKLHPKTISCVFLGYPTNTKGYLCLDPITKRIYTSRHVLFNENIFPGLTHNTDTSSSNASPPISSDTWITTLLYLHTCSHTTIDNPCLTSESCPVSTTLSPTNCDSALTNPNAAADHNSTTDQQTSILTQSTLSLPNNPTIFTLPSDPTPTQNLPTESAVTLVTLPTPATSAPAVISISDAPAALVPHPMHTRSKSGIFKHKVSYTAQTQIDYSITEPNSYTTASKHPQWCTAMHEEFQALQKQGTWALVP